MKSNTLRSTSSSTQKDKLSTMSRYYNRELTQKRTPFEEMQIFRWLQLLQVHYQVFNVRNYHDCLNDDRYEKEYARLHQCQAKPVVVQPFASISNFYGCVVCGKYHICELKRETCPLIVDRVDKQKACAYSGKMLLLQDNLEAKFEDAKHAEKEATYLFPIGKKRSSPKKGRNTKKPQRTHIQDLYNQSGKEEHPKYATLHDHAHKSKKRLRVSDECRHSVKEAYDLSLESLSESEHDEVSCEYREPQSNWCEESEQEIEEDTLEQEKRPIKRPRLANDDEDEEEGEEDEQEEVYESREIDEDDETIVVDKEEEDEREKIREREWLIGNERDNEDSGDEGVRGGGSIAEYDNENGEGDRAKNYHNNIRYNNEYYAFLMPVVLKQQKKRLQVESECEKMDEYDRFIDLYKRDNNEDERFYSKREDAKLVTEKEDEEDRERLFRVTQQLGESTRTKIHDETSLILSVLIKIDSLKSPECKIRHSVIHQKLLSYFLPLIQNVTLLVYQSPVMSKLAMTRCTKNQNQVPKFGLSTIDIESVVENPQNDLDYHEYTLCPTKIVRALLFQLFIQPFSMTDAEGYRIDVWDRHFWLTRIAKQQPQGVCVEYYRYVYRHDKEKSLADVIHFKKETQDSAVLIHECLSYYKFCPLWLREMVLTGDIWIFLNPYHSKINTNFFFHCSYGIRLLVLPWCLTYERTR